MTTGGLRPPLHEFLPSLEDLIRETTHLKDTGEDPERLKEAEKIMARVEELHEANPMLGLRGVRLSILFPEIPRMQVRAIMEAACNLRKRKVDAQPEIMIPLAGTVAELQAVHQELKPVAEQVQQEKDIKVPYKFGTMIEIPRAALVAGEIAKEAEFFSFGTNDLTKMTFGYSRDDADRHFFVRILYLKIRQRRCRRRRPALRPRARAGRGGPRRRAQRGRIWDLRRRHRHRPVRHAWADDRSRAQGRPRRRWRSPFAARPRGSIAGACVPG